MASGRGRGESSETLCARTGTWSAFSRVSHRGNVQGLTARSAGLLTFVEAVTAHAGHQRWPGHADRAAHYDGLMRLRMTDLITKEAVRGLVQAGARCRCRWTSSGPPRHGGPTSPTSSPPQAAQSTAAARDGSSRSIRPVPGPCGAWPVAVLSRALLERPLAAVRTRCPAAVRDKRARVRRTDRRPCRPCRRAGPDHRPGNEQEALAAAVEGWIHLPGADGLTRIDPSSSLIRHRCRRGLLKVRT